MSGYLTCWLVFHSDPLPQLPVPVRMDWLHCNQCYRREGIAFVVASCGHIVCESCVNPSKFLGLSSTEQCTVCGTSCNYLHISDKMKPQEQAYFSDPVKLMHSRLEHISQVALFQNRQKEKITAYFKQKSVDLEKRLKEVKEQSYRYSAFASVLLWEVSELRRENAELKKPLSQRRVSVGNFQTSSSNRMSRPVAITPPVTPGLRLPSTICTGSGMSIERYRDQHSGIMTTPGSVTSVSSLHSLRDPGLWTPISSIGTAHRTDPATPNFFRFGAGSALLSPIPRNNQHSGTAWIQN
ncbi:RING finger protein 212B-like isoform X12 [Brienomyrus brachyistius]|uniref:RING finger protein 212B-like isoform X12 n=1 Tax=Brienomyrus brachyistius TaxID=42636 RepID=UPI0020B3A228|nr:RING finger protein 212B-like isoform X12 [Brienomyrus brachyistius]